MSNAHHCHSHRSKALTNPDCLIVNRIKLIETYSDEDPAVPNTGTLYDSQQRPNSSPLVVSGLPEDDHITLDRPEQKSILQDVDNEKYLSSDMFPVFKHMRQDVLRDIPSKSSIPDPLQSPRSPSLHQLALSDMRYERIKQQDPCFQHLDQAFSKITHSPPLNESGTRPFSVQGQPKFGVSMCSPRCSCRCHSNRSVAHLSLSAFTNTFGAFSFSFTGPNSANFVCTDSWCRARRARWLRITYVFPSWLFRAAITASFSDGIGSPELLIRLCRVVSTRGLDGYYNIFGCK